MAEYEAARNAIGPFHDAILAIAKNKWEYDPVYFPVAPGHFPFADLIISRVCQLR